MAHQSRDVMAGLEVWRGNGHMDAMCSARARVLVQSLTRVGHRKARKNAEKLGKNYNAYGEFMTSLPFYFLIKKTEEDMGDFEKTMYSFSMFSLINLSSSSCSFGGTG